MDEKEEIKSLQSCFEGLCTACCFILKKIGNYILLGPIVFIIKN